MRQLFVDELVGMVRETRPEKMYTVYCDYTVAKAEEQDADEFNPEDIRMVGEGGTRFQPVFDWVEEQGIEPEGLIYMTDLEGPMPVDPGYPVLWVTPDFIQHVAPFGTHVKIPKET
jgi:predicted metal-dependent peptidase